MFSEEIIEELKHYVYRLIDPREGKCEKTFYIGKGTDNRVFAHAKAISSGDPNEKRDEKLELIKEINNANVGGVKHIIHRHGMDEKTAFAVESALIDAYDELLNKQEGHDSSKLGAKDAQAIIKQYGAEEIKFKDNDHKLILLPVNHSASREGCLYEAVRWAWKLNKKQAEKADYVLALEHNFVRGVFVAEKWLPATDENFKRASEIENIDDIKKKIGFIGKEAETEIQEIYLGKKLPKYLRAQNRRYSPNFK